jgi:hypothetical protein
MKKLIYKWIINFIIRIMYKIKRRHRYIYGNPIFLESIFIYFTVFLSTSK